MKRYLKICDFLVQDENDRQVVMSHGFNHVEVVGDNTRIGEVSIQKAESQHGNFIMKYPAGHTAGYVFTHPQEKTLYHAGDTIWYAGVKRNLKRFRPEVITLMRWQWFSLGWTSYYER